jgi:hypothetical protein
MFTLPFVLHRTLYFRGHVKFILYWARAKGEAGHTDFSALQLHRSGAQRFFSVPESSPVPESLSDEGDQITTSERPGRGVILHLFRHKISKDSNYQKQIYTEQDPAPLARDVANAGPKCALGEKSATVAPKHRYPGLLPYKNIPLLHMSKYIYTVY